MITVFILLISVLHNGQERTGAMMDARTGEPYRYETKAECEADIVEALRLVQQAGDIPRGVECRQVKVPGA